MSKDFKLKLIDYGNARRIQSTDGRLVDAVGVTEFTGTQLFFGFQNFALGKYS